MSVAGVCVTPRLDNVTRLVRISRLSGPDVIFLGHPLDLYYSGRFVQLVRLCMLLMSSNLNSSFPVFKYLFGKLSLSVGQPLTSWASGLKVLHQQNQATNWRAPWKNRISSTSMKLRKSLVKPVTRQNISSCSVLSPEIIMHDAFNVIPWTSTDICVVHDDLGWKNRTTHCNRFWRAGCSRFEIRRHSFSILTEFN